MRDGNVPRFFLCGEVRKDRPSWWGSSRDQLAGPANPAKQDPAVPAFHDIAGAGRKGREMDGREDRKKGGGRRGWKKMENYLLNK